MRHPLRRLWHWLLGPFSHNWKFTGEETTAYDIIKCRCGKTAKVPGS